ncbi:hypothetical protein Pyn_32472 [Prunus yedoensis var. nudiflora]|uniref:Uncharacterized protein n=1 Tax=Prunus yedoensis var. nudiflora TaxID=2094558 RepID=A0A314ZSF0_PRUYE|nr:hypothetical protein Pyn_32472 [Prunus yedoensis var. nudiflora]
MFRHSNPKRICQSSLPFHRVLSGPPPPHGTQQKFYKNTLSVVSLVLSFFLSIDFISQAWPLETPLRVGVEH